MSRRKFDGPAVFEIPLPEPTTYHVIVRPRPSSETLGEAGLIVAAKRTKDADLAVRTIGQIMALGALANKIATKDMDPMQDPVSQALKVGDWVVYAQHAGQKLQLRKNVDSDEADANQFFRILNDTDILARFRYPAEALRFLDWI